MRGLTLADQLQSAEIRVVFTGTATMRGDEPSGPVFSSDDPVTWTFDVDAVHRGPVTRTTEIRTAVSDASCGVDFVVDRRYLVLARVDTDGVATAALCSGTQPFDELSAADVALLGPGTPPVATAAAPASTNRVGTGPVAWVAAAVLGAAAVSVVVVAVRRRRRA